MAAQIGGSGFVVDVTSRESIDAAFAAAGTPDIVIANAGIAAEADLLRDPRSLGTYSIGELRGAFHTIQSAARLMKPRRSGAIVLTASTNSYDGHGRLHHKAGELLGRGTYEAEESCLAGIVGDQAGLAIIGVSRGSEHDGSAAPRLHQTRGGLDGVERSARGSPIGYAPKASVDCSSKSASAAMPALAITMSGVPAAAKAASIDSRLVTSTTKPLPPICAATFSGSSRSRSKIATEAPLAANSFAVANPSPFAPPVTTARLPLKPEIQTRACGSFLLRVVCQFTRQVCTTRVRR